MSRQYDAKQAALKAYPNDRESGVDMFYGYMNCDQSDFEYEEGMTAEEYIYGDVLSRKTSPPAALEAIDRLTKVPDFVLRDYWIDGNRRTRAQLGSIYVGEDEQRNR